VSAHTCSARTNERCPTCGHEDTRDDFEGWETRGARNVFFVRCRECEAPHPDQSDHDNPPCDACYEAELTAEAR
jgi:hypothetical protein